MSDTASSALERVIAASRTLQAPASAAVVQLARLMASQVDAAGPAASTRLTAAYLSALKDLRRLSVGGDTAAAKPASRLAFMQAIAARTTEPTA